MLVSKCTIIATRLCLAKLLILFTLKVSLYVLMLGESPSIILLFKGAIFWLLEVRMANSFNITTLRVVFGSLNLAS